MKIHAHFERMDRINLVDAYDAIGTYILWSANACVRPSYIGEGNVLSRLTSHLGKSWATRPLNGCIALQRDGTTSYAKARAELIEAVLLAVADIVDRYPPNNGSPGKAQSAMRRVLRRAGHDAQTIRIAISGQDPLLAPERPPMRSDKWIVLRREDNIWALTGYDWNRRQM